MGCRAPAVAHIDVSSGKELWRDAVGFRFGPLAFSEAGDLLAAGVDREVRVYEGRSGNLRRRCVGRIGGMRSVGFSPDGLQVVGVGEDPKIHIWNVNDPKKDFEVAPTFAPNASQAIYAAAFTPDSRSIVAFIPKYEKPGFWERLQTQSSVDMFENVGSRIVSYDVARRILVPILDTEVKFDDVRFATRVREFVETREFNQRLDIWKY